MTVTSLITRQNGLILFGLASLAGVFLYIFSPTWLSLYRVWSSSDDYSHGFLIVPLSLYILWMKREELKAAPINPPWWFFPPVLLALLLYIVAVYGAILTLRPLAMVATLAAGVLFLFGWQVFRICAFPLFLLLFMIPVPAQIYAQITLPLQLLVTKMAVSISQGMGIMIFREGNVIYLPDHVLQVVEACSGLRSIMALITLGVLSSYFLLRSVVLRTIITAAAIPIAIFVNVIRVLLMIFAFYYWDFDLTEEPIHTFFGLAIFGLAILLFFLLIRVLALCDRYK